MVQILHYFGILSAPFQVKLILVFVLLPLLDEDIVKVIFLNGMKDKTGSLAYLGGGSPLWGSNRI